MQVRLGDLRRLLLKEARAAVKPVEIINGLGGARAADFLGAGHNVTPDVAAEFGFRPDSLRHWRDVYAGKSPEEATYIATHLKEPIKLALEPTKGEWHLFLIDGRHRLTAAREAGASHIVAVIHVYGPRGGLWRKTQEVVKI